MNEKTRVIKEFEVRVFDESYKRIYKCLDLIKDEHLWISPQSNIPSVGCLILHLAGNARQWILSGIGGIPDNRVRSDEFKAHPNIRKSELVFLLENLKVNLKRVLNEIPDQKLGLHLKIQGFDVTIYSAIIHVLEHFSYHTGQITTLTKLFTNVETGYYSGLNLDQKNNLN